MTLSEVGKIYKVDSRIIRKLIENGVLQKRAPEEYDFGDDDIKKLSEILFLRESGLSDGDIVIFFKTDTDGRARILREVRRRLLGDIHHNEKKIGKLDSVLYQLKTDKEKKV